MSSLDTQMAVLRAVDHRFESTHDGCWLNTTSEIAAVLGVSRQRVAPLLNQLAAQEYVFNCEQPDGSVTWHLYDKAVKLIRGEREIVVRHDGGWLSRPGSPADHIIAA